MIDIVAMPRRIGQKKYLVLARKDLMNQLEEFGATEENKVYSLPISLRRSVL